MLISLNWLKEYIELNKDLTIDELENALTMIGQEVEKIEKQGENLEKILTSKIVKYEKHPNSDHLTICQVDNGSEVLQVICGAPNHKKGDIVAMAQIGAKLSEDFIIKKGKIRGEESNGMLCSESEMNIGNDSSGIMILPENTELGIPMNKYLGLNDTIFELEITPNRPDCLSHIGIARELSAYYNKELKIPLAEVKENLTENIEIDIEKGTSNRYLARVIKNVKVGKSPKWLKDRLEAVGIRSINNLVDISNYVMLETNQPNHIFDFDKFNSKKVLVKKANKGDKIVTLDGNERELLEEDIVINNGKENVAIAGVMGGANTEVSDETRNILIEVAHFDNISVRKTSRRLALSSESSYRFERRVDSENMIYVMNRITSLIQELAGGEISNINDSYPEKISLPVTTLNFDRMNRFIGKEIEKDKVINLLERLDIKVEDKGDRLILTPPSHRADLLNEFDYFEEVIRLVGFDNIENVMPEVQISKNRIIDNTKFITESKIKVSNLGLREVINYSFIPKDSLSKLLFNIDLNDVIEIKNPIIEDFSILRPTLMYSLIKNVKDNFNRGSDNIRLFEISKSFRKTNKSLIKNPVYIGEKVVSEENLLGLILAGKRDRNLWNPKQEKYDFYDMKGIIEDFFDKLNFDKYQIKRSINLSYHPGRSVDIFVGKELIGTFGNLHPDVEENMDIEDLNIVYGEINLDLLKKYIKPNYSYKSLSKYQSVPRDIAVVVKKDVLVGEMLKTVKKIDSKIEKVELFDIYEGMGIEVGHKSVAISILLRDDNKTLGEQEINDLMDKIINKLYKDYGAILR